MKCGTTSRELAEKQTKLDETTKGLKAEQSEKEKYIAEYESTLAMLKESQEREAEV